jgi:hypothetical protein
MQALVENSILQLISSTGSWVTTVRGPERPRELGSGEQQNCRDRQLEELGEMAGSSSQGLSTNGHLVPTSYKIDGRKKLLVMKIWLDCAAGSRFPINDTTSNGDCITANV